MASAPCWMSAAVEAAPLSCRRAAAATADEARQRRIAQLARQRRERDGRIAERFAIPGFRSRAGDAASDRTASQDATSSAGMIQRRRALADMVTHYPTCTAAQIFGCWHHRSSERESCGRLMVSEDRPSPAPNCSPIRRAGRPGADTTTVRGLPGVGDLARAGAAAAPGRWRGAGASRPLGAARGDDRPAPPAPDSRGQRHRARHPGRRAGTAPRRDRRRS